MSALALLITGALVAAGSLVLSRVSEEWHFEDTQRAVTQTCQIELPKRLQADGDALRDCNKTEAAKALRRAALPHYAMGFAGVLAFAAGLVLCVRECVIRKARPVVVR